MSSSKPESCRLKWVVGSIGVVSVIGAASYFMWKHLFSRSREFDDQAANWDSRDLVQEMHKNVISSIKNSAFWKDRVRSGKRIDILDFGGGTGLNTLALAAEPIVSSAVCADVSSSMISAFNAKIASEEHKRVSLKCSSLLLQSDDAEEIKGKSFDMVLAAFVMHHLTESDGLRAKVMERLGNCTKSAFVICEFEEKEEGSDPHHHSHEMQWKVDQVRPALTAIGFEVSELVRFEVNEGKWKSCVMFCTRSSL